MNRLPITGEYPPDWKEISDRVWAEAGHRCIRCGHPYRKGEHGKGEWTPCDALCTHKGPICFTDFPASPVPHDYKGELTAAELVKSREGRFVQARWRIGTVHHLDGNKANCAWWNLLALCQRCHLTIQSRVLPERPWILEHSDWFKPYVAGFYAKKYLGRDITRAEAVAELDRLLALERLA